MSDLEDELLALAGGDVSSDDEQIDTRDDSESPAPKARKDSPPAKSGAKVPAKKTNRNADESEDEGEA